MAASGSMVPTTSRPSPSRLPGWNICGSCSRSTNAIGHPRGPERMLTIKPDASCLNAKLFISTTFGPILNTRMGQVRRLAAFVHFLVSRSCEKDHQLDLSPWTGGYLTPSS